MCVCINIYIFIYIGAGFFSEGGGFHHSVDGAGTLRCSVALLVQKYLLSGTEVQTLTPEEHQASTQRKSCPF
jgi:hypothetical protein